MRNWKLWLIASLAAGAFACSDDGGDNGTGGTDAEAVCDDGVDNDEDGDVDCDDSDCASDAACTGGGETEVCTDGIDNDGDGAIDCDDSDCADDAACATADEVCDDGEDNDGDGDVDCDDADCDGDDACEITPEDEICDDGEDNDDDGDVDCDDDDCADDEACASACGDGTVDDGEDCDDGADNSDENPNACRTDCTLPVCGDGVTDDDEAYGEECDGGEGCADDCTLEPFCGDGTVDDGEECDAGEENSDRVPDTCRPDCTNPICGDGVVDTGEQCDDGEDNGADAACSATCAINVEAACADTPDLIDLAEAGTTAAGVTRYIGNLSESGSELSPPVDCVDEGVETGADDVLVFTPEDGGTYRVTTNLPATGTDTVVYALDNCVDGAPVACGDDDGLAAGSTLFIEDAIAGAPIFIVVDSIGDPGQYAIAIEMVDGIAADGEACGDDIACDVGLSCESDVCVDPLVAPEITDIAARRLTETLIEHVITGTDANANVVDLRFEDFVLADESVFAGPLTLTNPPLVTFDGTEFTIELNLDWDSSGIFDDTVVGANFVAIDATGLESEPFTVEYEAWVEPTEVGVDEECSPDGVPTFCAEGLACADLDGDETFTCVEPSEAGEDEECDITGATIVCAEGLFCTLGEDDAGATCLTEPTAPTLDAIEIEYVDVAADATIHRYIGTDPNQDVTSQLITAVNSDVGVLGPFPFPFDSLEWDGSTFTGEILITGVIGVGAADITANVSDATGLTSENLTVDYPELPEPVLLVEGEECEPGNTDAICSEGLVCGASDFGGFFCEEPAAPVITTLEGVYADEDETLIDIVVVGEDDNGDFAEIALIFIDATGATGELVYGPGDLTPSPAGQTAFRFAVPEITTETFFVEVCGVIIDSTGAESELVCDPLVAEGGDGDDCSFDGTEGACDPALGLTCGADETCEEAVAPELTALSSTRLDEDTIEFTFTGTDANGDVVAWFGTFYDAEGEAVATDLRLALDDDIRGTTDFTVTATITGFTDSGLVEFDARLVDAADLESETLSGTIAPIVGEDEACTGDGVTDLCADGLSCDAETETCTSNPPTLTEFTVTPDEESPRELGVAFAGVDLDEDVVDFALAFLIGDEEVTATIIGGEDVTIVWGEDGAYTATATIPWGIPAFAGVDAIQATAIDSIGNESESLVEGITPFVGFGDECDPEGLINSCGPGLVCTDGDPPTCDIDAEDPCGGIPTLAFADEAEAVDGGDVVAFDSLGRPNLESGSCGGRGGEVAIAYTAPANGLLTVTTVGFAEYDTLLHARSGICVDPASELACNDDTGGLQSTLEFEVTAGELIYVFADGFDASGSGEMLFTLREIVGLGDECDPEGLENLCSGALACEDDGEGTFVCTGAPGTCDVPNILAELAVFDAETNTWTVDGTTEEREDRYNATCASSARSGDQVYSFTPPTAGVVTAELTSPAGAEGYDTALYARADCADAGSQIVCNDDAGSTRRSLITFDVLGGEEVFLFVDGFGATATGPYTLAVTLEARAGLGESCVELECAGELVCFEDTCEEVVEVATGETCNEITTFCAEGDVCFEGECETIVTAADGESCNGVSIVCDGTLACIDGTCADPGGTCELPTVLAEAATYDEATNAWTYEGSTEGRENTQEASCASSARSPDQVFEFEAIFDGTLDIELTSPDGAAGYDTALHVRADACADAEAELACNDDAGGTRRSFLSIDMVAGTTYFIVVDGWSTTNSGPFTLVVTESISVGFGDACDFPGAACSDGTECVEGTCLFPTAAAAEACDLEEPTYCEIGLACDGATALCVDAGTCARPNSFEESGWFDEDSGTWRVIGDTTDEAGAETGTCGSTGTAADYVYSWTAPADGEVVLAMTGDYDTALYVRMDTCADGDEVDCNDDGDGGVGTSDLTFDATGGTEYFIFADGWSGNEGAYIIDLTFTEAPPVP